MFNYSGAYISYLPLSCVRCLLLLRRTALTYLWTAYEVSCLCALIYLPLLDYVVATYPLHVPLFTYILNWYGDYLPLKTGLDVSIYLPLLIKYLPLLIYLLIFKYVYIRSRGPHISTLTFTYVCSLLTFLSVHYSFVWTVHASYLLLHTYIYLPFKACVSCISIYTYTT